MDTQLILLDETDSTQDVAVANYEGSPLLVVAQSQTQGRGRHAKHWENAPRSLAMSLAFDPLWPVETWPRIGLLAGVAVATYVDHARLKWPNDVLVSGNKVAGILVEGNGGFVVVGIGVNLWWPDAPDGYGAVSDKDPGVDGVLGFSNLIADELQRRIQLGPTAWGLGKYRDLCETVGQRVSWKPDGEGEAFAIAESGALLVNTDEGMKELFSGEVQHVRKLG